VKRQIMAVFIVLAIMGCKKDLRTHLIDPQSGPWEHPNTVENGLGDTALDCTADSLPANKRHRDTTMAFENLKNSTEPTIVLVGHGTGGSLCTGNGRSCTTSIRFDNWNSWKSEAEKLRPNSQGKMLRILACNLAWGEEGKQLVQMLANSTGRTVSAPYTMVYCPGGKVTLKEPKWFQATPLQMLRNDIHTEHHDLSRPPSFIEGKPGVSSTRIEWLAFTVDDFQVLSSLAGHGFRPFVPLSDWPILASQIDFDHPFHPGEPLGIVTARVTLKSVAFTKHYSIYADGVARDDAFPDVFFPVSAAFTDALTAQRR
jgi:hypothetical protein